jgi:hypothetical protein
MIVLLLTSLARQVVLRLVKPATNGTRVDTYHLALDTGRDVLRGCDPARWPPHARATAKCYAPSIIIQTTNVQRERDSMRLSEKSPSWPPLPYLVGPDVGVTTAQGPHVLRKSTPLPAHLLQYTMYTTSLVRCPSSIASRFDHTSQSPHSLHRVPYVSHLFLFPA